MSELVEVTTTVASEADAERLARALVESGLAACVTFFPVRSVYRWEGQLQNEQEFQIVCKTTADRAAAAEARLREIHPYEIPAILRLPVLRCHPEYERWVRECTAEAGP